MNATRTMMKRLRTALWLTKQRGCECSLFRTNLVLISELRLFWKMSAKRKSSRASDLAAKKAKKEESCITFDLEWKSEGELKPGLPDIIYLDGPDAQHSSKVAAFDIDGTIIRTKSGRTFSTGRTDWVFFDGSVPKKLKELHDAGTKVVFITNQAGMEKGKADPKELQGKFEDIINAVGVPIQVFVCPGNNHYRKPSAEMWKFLEKNCNDGVKIDPKESIFVGDAAGRPKGWAKGKSKDFSSSDRMFAANIGVQFATPEGYFLGDTEHPDFTWGSLDPVEYLKSVEGQKLPEKLHSESQEVVVLIGRPASGKSTLKERYFTPHNYVAVNRDTLGTQQKCLTAAKAALKAGNSVLVDNTNPSKASRMVYISLAKQFKVPVRCIHLNIPLTLSHHLNMYRQTRSKGKQRRVPEVGYRVYDKNFEKPEVAEGFTEVKELPFLPQFDSSEDEQLFKQWTC